MAAAAENPSGGGPTITGPDGHVLRLPAPENPVAATYRKFVVNNGILKTSTHFGTDGENKIVKGKVRRWEDADNHRPVPNSAPPAAGSTVDSLFTEKGRIP